MVVCCSGDVRCGVGGEATTLALDLLMTCAFGFLDISFSDPLSNLLRFAGLFLSLWGLQIFEICRVLWDI